MIATNPLFHSPPAPRRGRPPGAKSRVVRDARSLGIHHFAFVRASLLGIDLRQAFTRYMAWGESTTDLRYIQNRRETLLKQIIEAGRHFDATLAPHAKVGHLLDLLRSDASVKPAVVLPSLEDWLEAEGMDPDAWSEAELLAEYKAALGLDNADALDAATDRLASWFATPVVTCLRIDAGVQEPKSLRALKQTYPVALTPSGAFAQLGQLGQFGAGSLVHLGLRRMLSSVLPGQTLHPAQLPQGG